MIWPLDLAGLLTLALASRLAYLEFLGDFIGADEAVGGLMALKIAQGEEFPLLLWEAHYGGTLTSYLGAVLFWVLDPSPWTFRLAALPLALVGVAAIAAAARALWGVGAALVAGSWLAVGPPLLLGMSSQAIGGYPEVLCFGGLTLWMGARLARRAPGEPAPPWQWACFGLIAGFGTYSLAFVLPVFLGILWAVRRHRGGLTWSESGSMATGFVLGVSPFLLYNIGDGGGSFVRLAGRVFDVSRVELSQASSVPLLIAVKARLYLLDLVRFPGSLWGNLPAFSGLPRVGVWLAAVALAVAGVLRARRRASAQGPWGAQRPSGGLSGEAILGWSALATLLFVWALRLNAARHLFPFYLLGALGLGALWARLDGRWRAVGVFVVLLALLGNVVQTVETARAVRPRVAKLVEALEARQVRFLFTDYFIAYPVVFLSREAIVASPAAGPTNVDRYPAYTQAVADSARPAYVFQERTEASAVFAGEMRRTGRTFLHVPAGEFDLYIPDRPIRPDELKLVKKF
jgi:hypothetical protein